MSAIDKNRAYAFQVFILNCILFILFLGYTLFSVFPNIKEIENQKSSLQSVASELSSIQKKWISYSDFESLRSSIPEENSYLVNLSKNITSSFYEKTIMNTKEKDFDTHYISLVSIVEEQKNTDSNTKREELIDSLLPQYSQNQQLLDDSKLTDFRFVNYVESLLYTFNLSTENGIWIEEIHPVEDYSTDLSSANAKNQLDSIDSNIFYIPLKLSLRWRKEWFIDFLTFAQNVANVSVEDWELKIYKDVSLLKKIAGSSTENIYQNQLFDVEILKMADYIDSDAAQVQGDFIKYIKEKQWKDDIRADVELRFYVKGLPNYKIKDYIKQTTKKFDELIKTVNQQLKEASTLEWESGEILIIINRLRSMSIELSNIQKGITNMNVGLGKWQWLDAVYNDATKYSQLFDQMTAVLDDDIQKLAILKNNKN